MNNRDYIQEVGQFDANNQSNLFNSNHSSHYFPKKQRTKKLGCFMLTIVPVTFLILFTIVFLVLGLFLKEGYTKWAIDFELKNETQYILLSDAKLKEKVDQKVEGFTKSQEETTFVEFTVSEGGYFLLEQLNDSLPLGLEINRGYIKPGKNKWIVYFQLQYGKTLLPWVSIDLQKDSIQSTQIYTTYVQLGEYKLSDYGLGFIEIDINDGINEAFLLLQSGGLTGRTIENVTFDEDGVTIRGSL